MAIAGRVAMASLEPPPRGLTRPVCSAALSGLLTPVCDATKHLRRQMPEMIIGLAHKGEHMENSKASILEDYYLRSLKLRLSGGLTRLSRTLAERARPTMERSDPSKYSAFGALVHRLEEYESIERQWGEGACLNFNHRATRELMSDTRADGTPVIHPRMIENGRRYQALVGTVESSACPSTASDNRAISA